MIEQIYCGSLPVVTRNGLVAYYKYLPECIHCGSKNGRVVAARGAMVRVWKCRACGKTMDMEYVEIKKPREVQA